MYFLVSCSISLTEYFLGSIRIPPLAELVYQITSSIGQRHYRTLESHQTGECLNLLQVNICSESCSSLARHFVRLVLAAEGWYGLDGAIVYIATVYTSLQSEMELDNTFRLLVEIEPIGRNLGVGSGLIEVALDHLQEVGFGVRRFGAEAGDGHQL